MGSVVRFPTGRAINADADSDAVRGNSPCTARSPGTAATLTSTLDSLTAALADIAGQIAELPDGTARMNLTVQHLHLNLAAFRARQAIADLERA